MDYRIIFSDIDGTLLNSSHQITENTGKAIRRLDQAGIPFILVSARMPDAMTPIQRALGIRTPMVCYSGALVQTWEGEALYSCQIPLDLAAELKDLAGAEFPRIRYNAYGGSLWLADQPEDPWIRQEEAITGLKARSGDLRAAFREAGGVHKLLFMGGSEEIEALEARLREAYPGLTAVRSKDVYLEVMEGSVCKSEGARVLCGHYGLSMKEAAAFGDGYNDLDLLLAAGAGYAMDNAPAEVKAAAARVAPDNDHEGVLAGIWECFGGLL